MIKKLGSLTYFLLNIGTTMVEVPVNFHVSDVAGSFSDPYLGGSVLHKIIAWIRICILYKDTDQAREIMK